MQEAYIKASNNAEHFWKSFSKWDILAVGAYKEDSNQTTITNGTTASPDNSNGNSGAAMCIKGREPFGRRKLI